MTKPVRIVLVSAGCIALLVLLAAVTAVFVARSDWLREKLRAALIGQAEIATGGRVEIGKFQLDWTGLTADVDGLVIHGTEAPGQAPFLAVDHVKVGIRIISLFSRDFRLSRIDVTHPRVHLIIAEAGGTNLPRTKVTGKTGTADTILNLKIGRFEVANGEAFVESPGSPPHTYPWSAHGRNLAALATYDRAHD